MLLNGCVFFKKSSLAPSSSLFSGLVTFSSWLPRSRPSRTHARWTLALACNFQRGFSVSHQHHVVLGCNHHLGVRRSGLDFGKAPSGRGVQNQDQPQRRISPFRWSSRSGRPGIFPFLPRAQGWPGCCQTPWWSWNAQNPLKALLLEDRWKCPERTKIVILKRQLSHLITCKL